MKNIYQVNYGDLPVRFVLKDDDIFVSKDDLYRIFCDCSPDGYEPFWDKVFQDEHSLYSDGKDKKSALLGDHVIGAVVHFHMAGNLLSHLSELIDVNNIELREIGFKVTTFWRWYCDIIVDVNNHYERSVMDVLKSVKNRLDRLNPPYDIQVFQEDGVWIGVCDQLGLVTEANSYEELTDKVWDVAPDLYVENKLGDSGDNIRISFHQEQTLESREAL